MSHAPLDWPTVVRPETSAARAAAHTVRARMLGQAAARDPLPDLKAVASLAGAEVVQRDLAAGADGCQALLIPIQGGRFRVVVDATPRGGWSEAHRSLQREVADHRMRFRIAHELGHTFFYRRAPDSAPTRNFACSPAEERFCDEFARSLLLPASLVKNSRSLAELLSLHSRYFVSVEVVVRTLADVTRAEVALFYWGSAHDQLSVQWTNVKSGARLDRWSHAIARALSRCCATKVGAANAVLLRGRNQALVVA